MKKNQLKPLTEMYGLTQGSNGNWSHLSYPRTHIDPTLGQNDLKSSYNDDNTTEIMLSALKLPNKFDVSEFAPMIWQKQFTDAIIAKTNNIVVVPPSAGKTMPLMNYINDIDNGMFFKNRKFVNFTGHRTEHLLFVVPTKQLALQIGQNDIGEQIYKIVTKIFVEAKKEIHLEDNIILSLKYKLNRHPTQLEIDTELEKHSSNTSDYYKIVKIITELFKNDVQNPKKLVYFNNPQSVQSWIETKIVELISIQAGSFNEQDCYIPNTKKLKPFIVGTYSSAEKVMAKFSDKITLLVIDEKQEVMPKPGDEFNTSQSIEKFESYANIFSKINKNICTCQLMTGSMNHKSLQLLAKILKSSYNVQFNIIPDEKHFEENKENIRNRSNIVIVPSQHITNFDDRVDLITNKTLAEDSYNLIMCFSKADIVKYMKILKDKLPILNLNQIPTAQQFQSDTINDLKSKKYDFKNPKPEDIINTFGDLKHHLYDKKDDRNLSNIKKINTSVSSTNKIFDSQNKNTNVSDIEVNTNDIDFLKYFDLPAALANQNEELDSPDKPAPILLQPNENNMLYQLVIRGVCPMIGGLHQRHKNIIMKLFATGFIKFMIATDAVGVGANLRVRNIYIPDLSKFNGYRQEQINESSTMQILHRAGREGGGATGLPQAFVHVQQKDVPRIEQIINDSILNPKLENPERLVKAYHNAMMGSVAQPKKSLAEIFKELFTI